jgi:hypothetical protein
VEGGGGYTNFGRVYVESLIPARAVCSTFADGAVDERDVVVDLIVANSVLELRVFAP